MNTPIEHGHPADDSRAFRRCLGQFATGVTVMTAQHGDERAGMAVNSFSALSLEPPLVLWSIRKVSGSLPVFRDAGHFAVNVLAADQVEVANLFATAGVDKFAGAHWATGVHGAPVLAGTIATMECSLEQVHEGGDHLILVGRVERFARHGGQPLLFAQGRYALTQEHPAAVSSVDRAKASTAAVPDDCSLLRLLHSSSRHMSSGFEQQRSETGLTVAQFRAYGWLRSKPRTRAQLQRLAYLGDAETADTIAGMLENGHVRQDADGVYTLTPAGRECAEASARRVRSFEAELVRGLDEQDLDTTRRVLARLVQHAEEL